MCTRVCVRVFFVCFIFSFSALVLTGEVHNLVRFLFPYLLDLVLLPFFLFFRRVRAELLACLRARGVGDKGRWMPRVHVWVCDVHLSLCIRLHSTHAPPPPSPPPPIGAEEEEAKQLK